MTDQLPIAPARVSRLLTADEFHRLADVPPEVEWFANLTNAHTRRAYETAVKDFMRFAGIKRPEEFRTVARAHVIAWRDELKTRVTRGGEPWSDASIRHRLSALAALFENLCDCNAVTHNPVKGVARPKSESGEGKTPALGDHQARKLLDAPAEESVRGKRDRAILSTLLFHALRREELCKLKVKDFRHARKRRAASQSLRQGRQNALSAAASGDQRAYQGLSRRRRPRSAIHMRRNGLARPLRAPRARARQRRPESIAL
jgi:integrase/recombinase XerD